MEKISENDSSGVPKKKNLLFATLTSAGLGYIALDASILLADGVFASIIANKLKLPSPKRVHDLMSLNDETALRFYGTKMAMFALAGGYGFVNALNQNRKIKCDTPHKT